MKRDGSPAEKVRSLGDVSRKETIDLRADRPEQGDPMSRFRAARAGFREPDGTERSERGGTCRVIGARYFDGIPLLCGICRDGGVCRVGANGLRRQKVPHVNGLTIHPISVGCTRRHGCISVAWLPTGNDGLLLCYGSV